MNVLIFAFSVCFMTMLGSIGAIFLKKGIKDILTINLVNLVKARFLYIGTAFYALGVIINILLLKLYDYTIVYPLTSITYVWTLIFSMIILKERVNGRKILGVVSILVGACIIGYYG